MECGQSLLKGESCFGIFKIKDCLRHQVKEEDYDLMPGWRAQLTPAHRNYAWEYFRDLPPLQAMDADPRKQPPALNRAEPRSAADRFLPLLLAALCVACLGWRVFTGDSVAFLYFESLVEGTSGWTTGLD